MKIFLLSFTLFLSAYLWATTFSLSGETGGRIATVSSTSPNTLCADEDGTHSGGAYSRCVKNLSDFCGIFTDFTENQCFEKSVNACDNSGLSSECVKDMAIYCEYNTAYNNNQCFEKAIKACSGNASAIRDISEASKSRALNQVQTLSLD